MTSYRFVRPGLIVLLSLALSAGATAQEPSPPAAGQPDASTEAVGPPLMQAGIGMMFGVPVGDFADNVGFAGGVTGHIGFGLGRSPVSIGAEASYLWYGSETRDVPLSGIPELSVPVETSNDIFLLHGRVRVQKPEGRVRPYLDGLFGFSYLVTTTTVEGDESCTWVGTYTSCSSDGDSLTNLDDFTFSGGAGAGVMIGMGASVRLDLSLRYLYGGEAEYLTEGAIHWEGGPTVYQANRSRTDLLLIQIGIAFGRLDAAAAAWPVKPTTHLSRARRGRPALGSGLRAAGRISEPGAMSLKQHK